MATYFHGNSEIQSPDGGFQTLVLMNPSYGQYSGNSSGNLMFLNSSSNSLPQTTNQFVGIPLPVSAASTVSENPNNNSLSIHSHHEIPALHGYPPRVNYNHWNPIDPNTAARGTPRGLSLTLSSQLPQQDQVQEASGEDVRISGGASSSVSGVTNGVSGVQSMLLNSKYLKAAQELLEEVVNVGKDIKTEGSKKSINGDGKIIRKSTVVIGESLTGEESKKRAAELTTAERQEIQMKKAKLITMLDEVEQRYRNYHHQMHIVSSSFEQVAGIGSAKMYTALALQTISKQFRCLKDAITGQIEAASKSLGEEDSLGGRIEGSRLKYVDHHLRQQRALQQLGMIQHNAWRPQRGLPERSVSVLRAWLFEHFLHPYPKDSDKHMLAKQTGLTRSQVSNWFINARVRLWKPMVEEMYNEEIKDQERNNSENKSGSNEQHKEDSTSQQEQDDSTTLPNLTPTPSLMVNQPGFSFMGQGSPNKLRNMDMLQSETEQIRQNNNGGYSSNMMGAPTNFIGGFGQYPIGEISRFNEQQFAPRFSGNGVSLTLGLPHGENLSSTHQNFLPSQSIQMGRRVEIGESNDFGSTSHSTGPYESINIQNPKRFAAQLLPDFVT